jgi:ribonuclease P protein component
VGNAVARNRAKRRLRALFYEKCSGLKKGIYIFVAKEAINSTSFASLQKDFQRALEKQNLIV